VMGKTVSAEQIEEQAVREAAEKAGLFVPNNYGA
jgi:hypothetical protein